MQRIFDRCLCCLELNLKDCFCWFLFQNLYIFYMFCFLYSTGNNVKAPEELLLTEKESTPAKRIVYPSDQLTEECKRLMLGIDLQLEHAIKQGSLKLNQLWFANYLKPTVTEKKEDAARVTIFFRIVRRTETIDYAFEGQHLLTPKSRNRNQN